MVPLAGNYEFEAIRPNVMGSFRDLLVSAVTHPAMLLFLDQAQSIGPGSRAAQRGRANGRERGLNENLAREIMELHTLGVRSGYTQADVTELARALTGWRVAGLGRGPLQRLMPDAEPGASDFAAPLHEPGERTILGKRYPAGKPGGLRGYRRRLGGAGRADDPCRGRPADRQPARQCGRSAHDRGRGRA